MAGETGVVLLMDYGRIRLRLKEVMDARSITRGALARKTDTRFGVIDKWYSGKCPRENISDFSIRRGHFMIFPACIHFS